MNVGELFKRHTSSLVASKAQLHSRGQRLEGPHRDVVDCKDVLAG